MDVISTGKDLKKWRKDNNLSQKELAAKINYSTYRISHIESEDARISKKMWDAVCKLHNNLHPQDDAVTETWRFLKQVGYIPIKDNVDALSTTLPILLSPKDLGDVEIQTAYMTFLSLAISELKKIKDINSFTDKESFDNEVHSILVSIKKAARTYARTKSASKS